MLGRSWLRGRCEVATGLQRFPALARAPSAHELGRPLEDQLVLAGYQSQSALTAEIVHRADVLAVEPESRVALELARGLDLDLALQRIGGEDRRRGARHERAQQNG